MEIGLARDLEYQARWSFHSNNPFEGEYCRDRQYIESELLKHIQKNPEWIADLYSPARVLDFIRSRYFEIAITIMHSSVVHTERLVLEDFAQEDLKNLLETIQEYGSFERFIERFSQKAAKSINKKWIDHCFSLIYYTTFFKLLHDTRAKTAWIGYLNAEISEYELMGLIVKTPYSSFLKSGIAEVIMFPEGQRVWSSMFNVIQSITTEKSEEARTQDEKELIDWYEAMLLTPVALVPGTRNMFYPIEILLKSIASSHRDESIVKILLGTARVSKILRNLPNYPLIQSCWSDHFFKSFRSYDLLLPDQNVLSAIFLKSHIICTAALRAQSYRELSSRAEQLIRLVDMKHKNQISVDIFIYELNRFKNEKNQVDCVLYFLDHGVFNQLTSDEINSVESIINDLYSEEDGLSDDPILVNGIKQLHATWYQLKPNKPPLLLSKGENDVEANLKKEEKMTVYI
ncbi:MAG: hypothetical protein FJ161_05160 [Gammaproteobacteria bacterium]|nr:hypothetical protein [Gammaproteobacteria bacterium]